jgi:hypothetical protein
VFEALNGSLGRLVLRHRTPPPTSRLEVWYLRLEVAQGQVARCRFTLRLPSDLAQTDEWQPADWERARRLMERDVRQALTDRLRAADVALNGDPADVVDTVLSTRLVRVEPHEPAPDVVDLTDADLTDADLTDVDLTDADRRLQPPGAEVPEVGQAVTDR